MVLIGYVAFDTLVRHSDESDWAFLNKTFGLFDDNEVAVLVSSNQGRSVPVEIGNLSFIQSPLAKAENAKFIAKADIQICNRGNEIVWLAIDLENSVSGWYEIEPHDCGTVVMASTDLDPAHFMFAITQPGLNGVAVPMFYPSLLSNYPSQLGRTHLCVKLGDKFSYRSAKNGIYCKEGYTSIRISAGFWLTGNSGHFEATVNIPTRKPTAAEEAAAIF